VIAETLEKSSRPLVTSGTHLPLHKTIAYEEGGEKDVTFLGPLARDGRGNE
jgi:hypothetical protein